MNFKTYDILASLIPGFLVLFAILNVLEISYDKDFIIIYTAIAFLFGYIINSISSWLEDFYFITWNGKPSDRLLSGKDIWKVKFYHGEEVRNLLLHESGKQNPPNDELFSIAMRYANGDKDSRTDDFNASYAFSRALLTTVLFGTAILMYNNYNNWRYYLLLPVLLIVWLRCKQRGYYYAREVLNTYLKKRKGP